MASRKFIEAWCKKKIKDLQQIIVDDIPNAIAKDTQRNFNYRTEMVGADDPNVIVLVYKTSQVSSSVVCRGNQVLFIEFGAGAMNTWDNMKDKPTTSTFIDNGLTEIASRPAGIVPLGQYEKGQGKNDYWIRPSQTMQRKGREHYVHTPNGGIKEGVLWTMGTRPVRALYRGIATGVRKIVMSKIRRLG